jgi:hypothetical protein
MLRRRCGSGLRSPRSFRYAPLPRLTPPTVCQPWSLLRKALIRAGKPSHTAGTLYAIRPKFSGKYIQKIVGIDDNIMIKQLLGRIV